jgi:hypothetical protein
VHQRRGIGSEVCAAVLHFAFTALDAEVAVTGAYSYNEARSASREARVDNSTRRDIVRGARDALLFRLARRGFRPMPDVTIDGFGACAAFGSANRRNPVLFAKRCRAADTCGARHPLYEGGFRSHRENLGLKRC